MDQILSILVRGIFSKDDETSQRCTKYLKELVNIVNNKYNYQQNININNEYFRQIQMNPRFKKEEKGRKLRRKQPYKIRKGREETKKIVLFSGILEPTFKVSNGKILTTKIFNHKDLINSSKSSFIKKILQREVYVKKRINLEEIEKMEIHLYIMYSKLKVYGYIFFYRDHRNHRNEKFIIKLLCYKDECLKHSGSYKYYVNRKEEFFKKRFNKYLLNYSKHIDLSIYYRNKYLGEIKFSVIKDINIDLVGIKNNVKCYSIDRKALDSIKNAKFYIMEENYGKYNINEYVLSSIESFKEEFEEEKIGQYLMYLVGKSPLEEEKEEEEEEEEIFIAFNSFKLVRSIGFKYAYLIGANTLDQYQSMGYGTILQECFENLIKKKNINWIVLSSRPEARGFWVKMGFNTLIDSQYVRKYMYKNINSSMEEKKFGTELYRIKQDFYHFGD